ncbi:hypothetical protein KC331_g14027 [Hortaea werneckii]|uniref:AB hydrolase-1 domain-containing protein n=1 Tax=Hortaea werneckii TaxID=91943 RepID=A0A3M7CSK8_HORWE|nr:hypothetical protein KC331_g14027 [Hortaea werneckii]KAI7704499.1 hypothetical protein KC353_g13458 [Hortaea werneckii]RMY55108.1 hypothetical protein D0865_04356 [Hortaea werneckii]
MRPTIILVHGAYHSSSHFDKLASCLQRAGYEVEAVDLPSVGIEQDPGDALRRDTTAVLHAIEKLTNERKNVVVFMHSYGGVCGSEAAASFLTQNHQTPPSNPTHGTITRLIYLNADILPQNQSWLDTHPATKHPLIANLPVTFDKTSNMLTFLEPLKYFYTPTTSPLEAEIASSTLKPMAISAFAQKAEFDASRTWAAHRVPVSYVGCKQDGMLPWEMQQEYVAGLRAAGVSVSSTWLDYDHSPFVSHAEEVAQLIEVAIDKSE